jgi:hypothetical protein
MPMVKRIIFSTLMLLTLQMFSVTGWTQGEVSFGDLFKQGTQFYQEKKYDKSVQSFELAVAKDPRNATALTNLALAQYQLGKKAIALSNLRKALSFDPSLPTARAGLKYVLTQMDIKDIPHQIETYETLRMKVLNPVELSSYLSMTALFLFVSGWLLLSYFGRRRKAIKEERAMPATPFLGILFFVCFLTSSILCGLKIYDGSIVRGTILLDKVSLQTAPGENQASVLDLYAGMEVVVDSVQQDWVQVTYPGAMTGWIKSASLIVTSGQ